MTAQEDKSATRRETTHVPHFYSTGRCQEAAWVRHLISRGASRYLRLLLRVAKAAMDGLLLLGCLAAVWILFLFGVRDHEENMDDEGGGE